VKDDRICLDSGKRGSSKVEFSEDEETLIIRMYKLVGKRWEIFLVNMLCFLPFLDRVQMELVKQCVPF